MIFNHTKTRPKKKQKSLGFTLIELMVVVSLVAVINGVILVRLPEISKIIGLRRTTNSISLIIREAQSNALSVHKFAEQFPGFGVHVTSKSDENKKIILFADLGDLPDGKYEEGEIFQEYQITTGDIISKLCAGSENNCISANSVDIVYDRSRPFSKITSDSTSRDNTFTEITIQSPRKGSGDTKKIKIWSSGLIETE